MLKRVRFSFRDRSEGSLSKFRDKLCVVDWSEIKSEDVSDYLEGFTSKIICLYCACFPLRTILISRKKFDNPWVTPRLLNLI